MPQTWPRWLLVPAVLGTLLWPTSVVIFDDRYRDLDAWLVLLALAASVVGGYRFYRRAVPDLFALTCIGFCCGWVAFVVALRALNATGVESGGFVLIGVLVVAILTFLVRWVRRLNGRMLEEARRDG